MQADQAHSTELLSGYQFLSLERLPLWRERAEAFAAERALKGTVLLAAEGVNFSLFGPRTALAEWLVWLGQQLGAEQPVLNCQPVKSSPFLRLKVRIRKEIVTFDPAVQPCAAAVGAAVVPSDWNDLIERDNVQLVDTRNEYEYRLGSFEGACNPGTNSFVEFKSWCESRLDPDRPVAMFCTGGVRCEKASAWLIGRGFTEVYQLHGGILGYLAETPADRSRWRGECFVFDDRVSLAGDLRPTGRAVCRGCRLPHEGLDTEGVPPISAEGRCGLCAQHFDAPRLRSLRERARQARLAAERGQAHFGPAAQA